ncbi:MAG: CBS domain-containing protein [Proteobacteria bacterium]|nr:CBS domain-containing protein [Pseudomonadota bacterium]
MLVETILATKGSEVATAEPVETVSQAVTRMEGNGIGALVIVDKAGAPVGILSERDIARGVSRYGAGLPDTPIASLMTRNLVTCRPEDSAADIMPIMTDRRIRHVPVLREGRLAGIVSIGDVVKVRLGEIEQEADQLRAYITGT